MSKIWENIVVETQEEVKATFSEMYASLDFGAYITPQDYFVSYTFETEGALNKAKEVGLLQEISSCHEQLLRKGEYPEEGIRDYIFTSQEDCSKECNGNWYYYYK